MAKVFRLHQGQDGTGWFTSTPITSQQLETIKTDGKEVATSIPSPFARVDLVKSAFRWVAENGIDGNTAQHKLVSDSLDVAQLFYASQKFSEHVEIVSWNPKDRLKDLIENGNERQAKYAETLRIFWEQDSVPAAERGNKVLYNFESVNRLYFLINKQSKEVIGGTSPATVFFASPDVLKATKNLKIKISDDYLFDDDYASLYKREASFVEYFYSLAKQPGFATNFPEVYSYLEEVRTNYLIGELQRKVSEIDTAALKDYPSCPVLDNDNDPCEILGIQLGVQAIGESEIEQESDFVIKSDYPITGQKPLVLPYHKFSNKWTYTTNGVFWDENIEIPAKNPNSPKNSRLPGQNDPYYWLSIDNFFEDKIIELPYPIDDTKFSTCGLKRHLLPLTPTFFKYFSADKISDYLKVEEKAGGLIMAELTIPVKGGPITFKKKYSSADKNIEKLEIHLSIFPFLKSDTINITHFIGLLDDRERRERTEKLKVNCFDKGEIIDLGNSVARNPGEEGELHSSYLKTEKQFDLLSIGTNSEKGCIIPKFRKCAGNSTINFAIDFGTTNTHIEYQHADNEAISFDNSNNAPLWQSLLKRNQKNIDPIYFDNEKTFEQEMLPYSFSQTDKQLQFPLRTALVHNRGIDFNSPVEIIRQVNNYLLLEELPIRYDYLELHTDLKWSNYANTVDEKKVESYIEFLATMVYYKTLILGGDPSKTTIIWFYPVSMDKEEIGVFKKVWKEVYASVFHQEASDEKIKGIPESIAPYFYYNKAGLCLSIDIGGGSSDLAVFDKSEDTPELISSVKFAGNAIFGDGYASSRHKNNSDRNGFVRRFKSDALRAVEGDDQKRIILNGILNTRKNSADFSSFLFALEQDSSNNFSYSRLLGRDKDLKLPILVFYGAIAYYSAHLLKDSGIGVPQYILLSGTASKTASIIDSTEKFEFLSSLFQFVFSKVYQNGEVKEISIELSEIPKEVTCKGALKAGIESDINPPPIKFWIGGLDEKIWSETFDKEKDVSKTPTYGEINDVAKSDIEDSLLAFYQILDQFKNSIRIEEKIEPSAYAKFQEIRDSEIKDFLIKGVKAYYKKDDYHIQESLFFYPLIGILNELAYALSEK
ncbi:hypothetical protein [Pareuzebyella sediminis]|uniref:hypothetical protein n=1 Tax=Pareuzebyella sediminis TaxID=2607998 RepID=UPI0011EC6C23|nr:hypothetical protein [Pareuzebyella sediminis]